MRVGESHCGSVIRRRDLNSCPGGKDRSPSTLPKTVRIEELLEGKRVCICVGAGGVGKTTVAAAIAMGAAANGKKVAVVTIDPAKRLADALGLQELDNQPRLIDRSRFADYGIDLGGELWAMMLDSKATFDEVIERLAPDTKARDEKKKT